METVFIKNGHLVDPKNDIDEKINLFIEGGKISKITHEDMAADQIIDAEGRIISPGFVDIHMHEDPYDKQKDVLHKNIAHTMIRMGVTTAIGGNCGDNYMDPAEYLDIVDSHRTATNIGLFSGHSCLRETCGGTDKYAGICDDVLAKMIALEQKHLDAGCFGLSFGLKYVPGTGEKEIRETAKLCRERDLLVTSHIRYDVNRVFEAIEEMADVARDLSVRVQISHICSMAGYGQMGKALEMISAYRKEGLDIECDCYPYNAFSTNIGETTYDEGFQENYHTGYDGILICNGKYAGMRCTKEIYDDLRANDPDVMTVGYFLKDEDVDMALMTPYVMLASDGVLRGDQGHPRAAGTFPRFISKYIKTGKISLSEGIGKMTAMPAERLHLNNKGHLGIGADADIVIFDPDTIQDTATYESPVTPPEGIDYVLISGKIATKDGVIVNDSLGKSVRSL